MNEGRKSPLSFAFDNHRRSHYQRRATLQHVIVGKQEQQQEQQNAKLVLESCLDNIKRRRERQSIKESNSMIKSNLNIHQPHNRYNEYINDNFPSSKSMKNVNSSRTMSDNVNSNSSKQDMLRKLHKAKTQLQMIEDGSNNGPSGSNSSDETKKEIPEQLLPRKLALMKNDLIHLRRRQSTRLLPVQVNTLKKKKDTRNENVDVDHDKGFIANGDNNNDHGNSEGNSEDEHSSYISNLRKQNAEFNQQKHTNDHLQRQKDSSQDNDSDSKNNNILCYKEVSKPRDLPNFKVKGKLSQYHHHCQQKQHFAKDYIRLAKEYKEMEKYRNNNPRLEKRCVVCKGKAFTKLADIERGQEEDTTLRGGSKGTGRNRSTSNGKSSNSNHYKKKYLIKVLFPCEHRPICNECWEQKQPWIKCPVCHEEIKIALNHNGNEVDEYWDWINEIKPHVPHGFLKSFTRQSRRAIMDAMAKSINDDCKDVGKEIQNNKAATTTTTMNDIATKTTTSASLDFTDKSQFHNKDVVQSKTCIIS